MARARPCRAGNTVLKAKGGIDVKLMTQVHTGEAYKTTKVGPIAGARRDLAAPSRRAHVHECIFGQGLPLVTAAYQACWRT